MTRGVDPGALERRLRDDPAGERQASEDRLRRSIAAEITAGDVRRVGSRVQTTLRPGFVPMSLAAAVLIAVAVVRLGWLPPGPGATPSARGDLLDRVTSAGAISIGVRPDHPQFSDAQIGVVGFDVDVARELARRLGLRADIVALPFDQMLEATGSWDLALPSGVVDASLAAEFAASDPYYFWPHLLLVPSSSGLRMAGDLDGRAVCAVQGDFGATWLEAGAGAGIRPIVVTRASDEDCLATLQTGEAEAVLTAELAPADLAVRPSLVLLTGGPPSEARSAIAAAASDPARLIERVDAAFEAMRADGTLGRLSKSAFGSDVTSSTP